MNTTIESTPFVQPVDARRGEIVPLQERLGVQVAEADQQAAEAVLTASRLEVQEEAGRAFAALFVP